LLRSTTILFNKNDIPQTGAIAEKHEPNSLVKYEGLGFFHVNILDDFILVNALKASGKFRGNCW
jgi:hypothetical protein